MIILSHDPGTSSYGWCVNSYTAKGFKVLELGKLHHPVNAVHENLDSLIDAYLEEVDTIVKRWGVTHMCFERFQARSTGLYNIIECINIMVGALMGKYRPSIKFDGFYASNWKNSVNARLKTEFGYSLDLPPARMPALPKKGTKEYSPEIRAAVLAERKVIADQRAVMESGYRNIFPGVSDHMVDAFFINVCGWYRATGAKPFTGVDKNWFNEAGRMVCKKA